MQINMGYLNGEDEEDETILKPTESEKADLMCHMSDLMPQPEYLGRNNVSAIAFNCLELGSWINSVTGATYNMQLSFIVHHDDDCSLSFADTRIIIDAVYENGANASYTPDADDAYPCTFLFPYYTEIIHDLAAEEDEVRPLN